MTTLLHGILEVDKILNFGKLKGHYNFKVFSEILIKIDRVKSQ